MMKKVIKRSILCIVVLFLTIPALVWGAALAKNAMLTAMHKDKIETMQLIESEEPLPEFDWYRITSYSDETIEIYFVKTQGKGTDYEYKVGGKMIFNQTPNGWCHTDMADSISWSGAGSAEHYIWPYWHHIFLA